jgi:histidine phosphotransferase ChpT
MTTDLQLMYLMCSKFCHDLAAPIGAISIGLEMLGDDPAPDSPQALLQHSIQSAIHKLDLIRCLSGYATQGNRPTLSEVRTVLDKCIDPGKIKIHWHGQASETICGTPARLYAALMMLSAEALPRGGELILHQDYTLTVTGGLVKYPGVVLEAIQGRIALQGLTSQSVIGFLIKTLADQLGTAVVVEFEKPNLVQIRFACP